ncbi:uncharacterized protein LOC114361602 isoform X2 [Ostrinia furnacalis]|uniref:uncharacterized protein LOC114361602 isoform X1 n=1 Tax=Ostrinia furnacalis TaxID=93504 RepID=UPI00103F5862|nr:uncharacterized protein LOC114361602 isoform X1 [Ostrinia furnacalis]XP_028172511.1 uncharacterized protein LOC114361602 isoform X2 [Ostrinia furnacalis]
MSLLHSPVKSTSGQECRSTPDLSTIGREAADPQITFRKRKQPHDLGCSCSGDVQDLRSEMARISKLLENFVTINQKTLDNVSEMNIHLTDMKSSNEQNFSLLTNNVSEVKKQINEIQESMSSLTLEQNQMKSQITLLEKKISEGEEKMRTMESNLADFKTTDPMSSANSASDLNYQMLNSEQIINEVQERNNRQKNIILGGIQEQSSSNASERQSLDMAKVMDILLNIVKDTPAPIKIFRIGKYDPKKNRRIKVCFDTQTAVIQLLRSKANLPAGIKIYSDQTPCQQRLMLNLQKELARRSQDGETDLIIKYIKGIPKLIKANSKNESPHPRQSLTN